MARNKGRGIAMCLSAGISMAMFFCISVAAAQEGALFSESKGREMLLAQADTEEEDALEDFDFFDDEEEEQTS